ncbi:hypothetical protein K1719_014583 [Acacia pycnantha]|nr:hypothetical protein K1719_014583 [Acacia pycnantha]
MVSLAIKTSQRPCKGIELNVQDTVAHKHIPYVFILVKMADEWVKSHGEKREFKELIKARMLGQDEDNYKEAIEASFKVFAPQGISSDLQQIINDSSAEVDSYSSDFGMLAAAPKEFIANEGGGETPFDGSIPNMTSSTKRVVKGGPNVPHGVSQLRLYVAMTLI